MTQPTQDEQELYSVLLHLNNASVLGRDEAIHDAKQAILALKARWQTEGAAQYIKDTYGERCKAKNTDDFPETKNDPLATRCLCCQEWERFDDWIESLERKRGE